MTTHTTTTHGRKSRPNNRQRGEALEDLLRWYHNVLHSNRRAYVWQNGVKSIVRKGAVIQLPSLPDFGAILTCMGGKYASFDAKLIARNPSGDTRYHHPTERLHQLETLWNVQESGGIAFLLISIDLERFFMIWPTLEWRDQRSFSLNLDKLQPHQGVEFSREGSYSLPDWLTVIEAMQVIESTETGA